MRVTKSLGPDGDSSVGLEPSKVLGDPGEGGGCAGFASQRGAEGDDADLGGEAVGLGDDQGAAGVAVAGGDDTAFGVAAQFVLVDDERAVDGQTVVMREDAQVDVLEVRVDAGRRCEWHLILR